MRLDDLPRLTDEARAAPVRRCDDCQLNLGRDVLRALGSCPRWGMRRAGVESRCASFTPKTGALPLN